MICPVCGESRSELELKCQNEACGWEYYFYLGELSEMDIIRERMAINAARELYTVRSQRSNTSMNIRAFDIGGSGVKTAVYEISQQTRVPRLIGEIVHLGIPDWSNFPIWLANACKVNERVIAISSVGFIDSESGKILSAYIANWHDKNLSYEISRAFPHVDRVVLLNDGEAHLYAHTLQWPNPQLCLSIGTSVGFGCSDSNEGIVRTLRGINFDIGEITIPHDSNRKGVWHTLGSEGLHELESELGISGGRKQFGINLGKTVASLCSVFRPATVVLSGGIPANCGKDFLPYLEATFDELKPHWLERPEIVMSPHGECAALVGVSSYAYEKCGGLTNSYKQSDVSLNGFKIIREAGLREVLEHFIFTEMTKKEYESSSCEIKELFYLDTVQFMNRVRLFADERADVHPVLTWTIGTLDNQMHQEVYKWYLAEIDLAALYTCGISPEHNDHLETASWNFSRFLPYAHNYPEFDLSNSPSSENCRVIGVVRHDFGKLGSIELLDGAHRVLSMLAKKVIKTTAYLAVIGQYQ